MKPAPRIPLLTLLLLLAGTLLGMAGTDLVLPAVPSLADSLGGTAAQSQWVLAAYTAGSALGLLIFGELGSRADQRNLLPTSLLLFAATSFLAGKAHSLESLIPLRFLQGAAGAASAVYAPGFIRAVFTDSSAVKAIGLLGSIESLVPALAPIAGAWLLVHFDWRISFRITAALTVGIAFLFLLMRGHLPPLRSVSRPGGYLALLRDRIFLRYALSQAFSLGGLLVFVFGAPAVIIASLGGGIRDFIVMQITGIAFFIAGANLTGRAAARFGTERVISLGTGLYVAGMLGMLTYALCGGSDAGVLPWLFVPINLGFGLRGPPGFYRALQAAHGDDARGSALIILGVLLTAALGTAALAPFLDGGLVALALASGTIAVSALGCLAFLPRLPT